MYRLERNKKLVGVNVRRYLLNCHDSNHPVSMAEIYDFCPRHKCGKRNEQASKIMKEYAKYGVVNKITEGLYEIKKPEYIKHDLADKESHHDLRAPEGFPPLPPMPLPIFGKKQVVGRLELFGKYIAKHIIYCHLNNYSVRAKDLKKYSDYKHQNCGTPSNLIKTLQSLQKAGALKRSCVPGYYTVEAINILFDRIDPEEKNIFYAPSAKVGRPRKPDEDCAPDELLKRQHDRERHWNNRKSLSVERQHDAIPAWLAMTESVIMNMNGTARHTPEIDGRWREFCR